MGDYTEIIFKASIKNDDEVIKPLNLLVNGIDPTDNPTLNWPNHEFFKSKRTWLLNSGGSYYFPGVMEPSLKYDDIEKEYYLSFGTNIKNYNQEIQKFLDWIKPYIEDGSGRYGLYAIVTYEDGEPKLYFLEDK